jgi:hypothetical protein
MNNACPPVYSTGPPCDSATCSLRSTSHFATSLPEVLSPLYHDTRSAEIPNSSILLITARDLATSPSNLQLFNCRILTRRPRGPTMELLALSGLRLSQPRVPNLWALTSRTSEFARSLDLCHLSSPDGRL